MNDMETKGRPSTYTPEIAALICERLATGESLRAICRDDGMPPESTVRGWVLDDAQGFSAQYARARDFGLDALAEEALEIANTPQVGEETEETDDGYKVKRGDMLGHRKLQIWTRLQLLAKWSPQKYGDKQTIDMNLTGSLAERLARARRRNG